MLGGIPKARDMVVDAIRWINLGRARQAASLLERALPLMLRNRQERSTGHNVKMTPDIGARVRQMRRKNPGLTEHQIAAHYGLSNGRVHEALHYGWHYDPKTEDKYLR